MSVAIVPCDIHSVKTLIIYCLRFTLQPYVNDGKQKTLCSVLRPTHFLTTLTNHGQHIIKTTVKLSNMT